MSEQWGMGTGSKNNSNGFCPVYWCEGGGKYSCGNSRPESMDNGGRKNRAEIKGPRKISLIGGLLELGMMAQEFKKNIPGLLKILWLMH